MRIPDRAKKIFSGWSIPGWVLFAWSILERVHTAEWIYGHIAHWGWLLMLHFIWWPFLIGIAWLTAVALWPSGERHKSDPLLILNYHWRQRGEMGRPDLMATPAYLRNDGQETVMDIRIQDIISGKWVCRFNPIPYLKSGESVELQLEIDFDDPSTKTRNLISVLRSETANKVTPVTILYRNTKGKKIINKYEFRWNKEQGEAKAWPVF